MLKKHVFVELQCEAGHERDIQYVEVEQVIQIGECDNKDIITHHNVTILELNNYFLTRLVVLDVVVMKLNTILTCFTEPVDN
jgi:hypothetical protein